MAAQTKESVPQKSSGTPSDLRAVVRALGRERRLEKCLREITEQVAELKRQEAIFRTELREVQRELAATPEWTDLARQLIQEATALESPHQEELSISNPSYVPRKDKQKLLVKIIKDYSNENPAAKKMSYTEIKRVLRDTYGIETASTGLFFRNELRAWAISGGTKNRAVLIPSPSVGLDWPQYS